MCLYMFSEHKATGVTTRLVSSKSSQVSHVSSSITKYHKVSQSIRLTKYHKVSGSQSITKYQAHKVSQSLTKSHGLMRLSIAHSTVAYLVVCNL
jgi:hypothetical protein